MSAISLAVTGSLLLRLFAPRTLVAAGLVLSALGTMVMAYLPLEVDAWGLIWPGLISGAGIGLFFVPLTAVAFGNMAGNRLDEAAGLYALMRGIGSSIGIAVVSWLFVRQGQIHWQTLIEHVSTSTCGRCLTLRRPDLTWKASPRSPSWPANSRSDGRCQLLVFHQ